MSPTRVRVDGEAVQPDETQPPPSAEPASAPPPTEAPSQSAPPAPPVLLEDRESGFSAYAPPDFRLTYHRDRGVYELRSDARGAVVEHMRMKSKAPPADVARTGVKQRGLEQLSEQADASRAIVFAKHEDGRRWTVEVRRDGPEILAVTAFGRLPGAAQPERPEDAQVLEWVATGATGGAPVELPEEEVAKEVKPIALTNYVTRDQMASGKVPAEPGWMHGGAGGALESVNDQRGEMHLGVYAMACIPGGMSAAMAGLYPGLPVAPYTGPEGAVTQVWPQLWKVLRPDLPLSDVRLAGVQPQKWGGGFQAALCGIHYNRGGVHWRGAIMAATAPIPADDKWLFYYSHVGVPDTDDGSVGNALVEAALAYNPGRSQVVRDQQTRQALTATSDTLKQMNTLQRQTFDKTNANWSAAFRY